MFRNSFSLTGVNLKAMEGHQDQAGEPGFEGVGTVEDLPSLVLRCPLACSHPGQSRAETACFPPWGLLANDISFVAHCTLTFEAHPGRALGARYTIRPRSKGVTKNCSWKSQEKVLSVAV